MFEVLDYIAKTIESTLEIVPIVTEDCVACHFGNDKQCFGQVTVMPIEDDCVEITLWFHDQNGDRLLFSDRSLADVLLVCNQLQEHTPWGTLMPYRNESGIYEIMLRRQVTIDETDNLDAELRLLCCDWDQVCVAVNALSVRTYSDEENDLLFAETNAQAY